MTQHGDVPATGAPPSGQDAVPERADFDRIPARSGRGFELPAGALLTVMDPTGGQVSDFFCFNAEDHGEWLSNGRTIDILSRWAIHGGDILYSNRSRPMVTMVADTSGQHDFLLTPCSQQTFDMLYPEFGGAPHPSCLENLTQGLAQFGIGSDQISTTLNIFMNVALSEAGEVRIAPPATDPGAYVTLRAEMDLHVGLTACSAEKTNGGRLNPIDFRITPPEPKLLP